MAAAEALIYYRKGPELLVPVVLRRIPTESPVVRDAFREVFWFVRLEPLVLPTLIEGLSSKNIDVRLNCTAAINHMGRDARPALPPILALIRKELETPQPADANDCAFQPAYHRDGGRGDRRAHAGYGSPTWGRRDFSVRS